MRKNDLIIVFCFPNNAMGRTPTQSLFKRTTLTVEVNIKLKLLLANSILILQQLILKPKA